MKQFETQLERKTAPERPLCSTTISPSPNQSWLCSERRCVPRAESCIFSSAPTDLNQDVPEDLCRLSIVASASDFVKKTPAWIRRTKWSKQEEWKTHHPARVEQRGLFWSARWFSIQWRTWMMRRSELVMRSRRPSLIRLLNVPVEVDLFQKAN